MYLAGDDQVILPGREVLFLEIFLDLECLEVDSGDLILGDAGFQSVERGISRVCTRV